ncbi:hypothetical protein BCL79_0775 [Stenotrophomonas rhizophila]|uniref:Uncharacterized protein n=1 Tax=Stenotrophomonas rhizophila TaxID=216778 RepID=A0A498CEN3_9GAMM|nr:hypothetical protein BCL79_0775 [Stenotrophomonas rhizophila]
MESSVVYQHHRNLAIILPVCCDSNGDVIRITFGACISGEWSGRDRVPDFGNWPPKEVLDPFTFHLSRLHFGIGTVADREMIGSVDDHSLRWWRDDEGSDFFECAMRHGEDRNVHARERSVRRRRACAGFQCRGCNRLWAARVRYRQAMPCGGEPTGKCRADASGAKNTDLHDGLSFSVCLIRWRGAPKPQASAAGHRHRLQSAGRLI